MEIGALFLALALVMLTSAVISSVGVGVILWFLTLGALGSGLAYATGDASPVLKRFAARG